jgi:hypothetical protein
MEPTPNVNVPPDRENLTFIEAAAASSSSAAAAMSATAVSLPSTANNQLVLYTERPQSSFSSVSSAGSVTSMPSSTAASTSSISAPIEKLSRPMAFDKVLFVCFMFFSFFSFCFSHF